MNTYNYDAQFCNNPSLKIIAKFYTLNQASVVFNHLHCVQQASNSNQKIQAVIDPVT